MSKIEIDGIEISGMRFNNPGDITGIAIPGAERNKIKENADYHRLGGKLLAVTEIRALAGAAIMILGRFTENPTPYFAMEEWGL